MDVPGHFGVGEYMVGLAAELLVAPTQKYVDTEGKPLKLLHCVGLFDDACYLLVEFDG